MIRFAPIVLVAGLLLLDGYVHGLWTNRWQAPQDLKLAAERLERVPMVMGDWHGESLKPLSDREVEQAGFTGYINRRYKNHETGAVISILLACGRPGPLSVHTPDICYRGAGYEAQGQITKQVEKNELVTAELWKTQFTKPDALSLTQLDVCWSWTTGNSWTAPDNPRVTFAGSPALYKLYVVHEVMRDDQQASTASSEFIKKLLPELNRCLFPKSKSASPPA